MENKDNIFTTSASSNSSVYYLQGTTIKLDKSKLLLWSTDFLQFVMFQKKEHILPDPVPENKKGPIADWESDNALVAT